MCEVSLLLDDGTSRSRIRPASQSVIFRLESFESRQVIILLRTNNSAVNIVQNAYIVKYNYRAGVFVRVEKHIKAGFIMLLICVARSTVI